jgi:hypothetical protein
MLSVSIGALRAASGGRPVRLAHDMADAQNFLARTATPTRDVSTRSAIRCRAAAQRISRAPLIARMHRALCLRGYRAATVLFRAEPRRDLVEGKPPVSACDNIFRVERHEPITNIVRVPSADACSSQTQSLTLGTLAHAAFAKFLCHIHLGRNPETTQPALAIRTDWKALVAKYVDAACNSFARATYPRCRSLAG